MTPLPPETVLRNRQLIAERLHWPDGALDACLKLEDDFPLWVVFWTAGPPRRGYQAVSEMRRSAARAFGATPEELREALETANPNVVADPWL